MNRRLTRSQRRAVTRIGLAADLLAFLALAGAVIAGVVPAGRLPVPAAALAVSVSIGSAYLYCTRRKP